MDSTLLAGLVGAGAALLVGFGGAVIANMPAWSLERRQSKKEFRDEQRRLMAQFSAECMRGVRSWNDMDQSDRADFVFQLLSLVAQIKFVLHARDEGVREFVEAAANLIVHTSPTLKIDDRVSVAIVVWNELPEWYRRRVATSKMLVNAEKFRQASAVLDQGGSVSLSVNWSPGREGKRSQP